MPPRISNIFAKITGSLKIAGKNPFLLFFKCNKNIISLHPQQMSKFSMASMASEAVVVGGYFTHSNVYKNYVQF